ncbi:MAG: ABC transporter permease, partial [Tissierellia bacterium]|nr:ABC transporter permease [Tissierellia bacterium]
MLKMIIKRDLRKTKLISATVLVFILLSSFLLSTSLLLFSNLLGSIDRLMEESKTPHFLQMHIGDPQTEELAEFAMAQPNVKDFQILGFVNVDSSSILVNGGSFDGHGQDNGFTYQSADFDYLLDLDGKVIEPVPGEVYVPLAYYLDGSLKEGDVLALPGVDLIVRGPLRDSQMNSTLASSKRFLVSEEDFPRILPHGRLEYLIEFLLVDMEQLSAFSGAYANANLPSNGPTLTYPLFKMINSVSEGILLAVLFLFSALVLVVCFLCIRFTLLSKIEEDYREIGVLKGIGIRVSKIKDIYLAKYLMIAAAGSLLGYGLSIALSDLFLEPIRVAMGEGANKSAGYLFGAIGALLIFLTVILYVNGVLNRFKKISASEAIRFGTMEGSTDGKGSWKWRNSRLPVNLFLGINTVMSRKKLYLTFAIVLMVSSFIMTLPNLISSTIASKEFVTYIGVGQSDLLLYLQQSQDLKADRMEIEEALKEDPDIASHSFYTSKLYEVGLKSGERGRLWTQLGDHAAFPVNYTQGDAPIGEKEIALSHLSAQDLEKQLGDTLEIFRNGESVQLTISGIYSDITNGGKTAKVNFSDEDGASLSLSALISLKGGVDPTKKAEEYAARFPQVRSISIEDYRQEIFGSTIRSVNQASLIGMLFALSLTFLITLLFTNMLVTRDRRRISVLKSLGYTT